MSELTQAHLDMLHASAISDEVIAERGYRTVTDSNELRNYGFSPGQCRPGLLLPVWTVDGRNGLYVLRPDNPRVFEDKNKRNPDGTHPNKVNKYEYQKGAGLCLDCPPRCQKDIGNPNTPLWITEGQKKADALASLGLCVIGLYGVWGWRGKNTQGGNVALPDWELVALKGRDIRIVFDSDVCTNSNVQKALERLSGFLKGKGANVEYVTLTHDSQGNKIGVDDWLAQGHTLADLENLVLIAPPAAKAAPDQIELLDKSPATLSRPLALIDGQAYAAVWPHVKVTRRESVDKSGHIIRHDPPQTFVERRMLVIRDDGAVFGDKTPLENLGLEIRLPEIPPDDRLWSGQGLKEFIDQKTRPNPVDVFSRLVSVVDRFIDFDRSLAGQREMSELLACYILSTWFLDAFNVAGFIWPNGDKGSGKTHTLLVISELAYLGQLILSGGSFASLRDLADYGATLAFDDAEGLSDPKQTDPDKRALLLAGNRRGAVVTVKELGGDKTWHTRHVNAFCPRLFSATRLPDPILSSRTVIIPLIRTPDRERANVDPLDYAVWPCDHRKLRDDLWALALTHLAELPQWDAWTGDNARLAGRALQPWRATLAVAAWLDAQGVTDLWQRIEQISLDYQDERPELEIGDFTVLVIRSIVNLAIVFIQANPIQPVTGCDTSDTSDSSDIKAEAYKFLFATADLVKEAVKIYSAEDLDFDLQSITSPRVGRTMGGLRLRPARKPGTGARQWVVTLSDINRLCITYGLNIPQSLVI